jgi:ketosteroid isomerase-like protein
MTDIRELVTAYIDAAGDRDGSRMREYVHPDATLRTGPTGQAIELEGRDAYVASFERLFPILERNDVRHVFVDGDQVAAVYDFVTDTPAGPVLTVELLRVEGDLIRECELLFELRRWPEVVAVLSQRS